MISRGSQPLPCHSLKESLILCGNGHRYQQHVILLLTLQTFCLTLLRANPRFTNNYYLGALVGSLAFAYFISWYGRITLLRQILFGQILLCFLVAGLGVWDFVVDAFFQIFMAFFAGFIMISLIYIVEISSENLKIVGPVCILLGASLGLFMQPIMEIFHWKISVVFFTGCPLILLMVKTMFFQESPRHLVIKKQFRMAKIAIREIAIYNKREMYDFNLEEE